MSDIAPFNTNSVPKAVSEPDGSADNSGPHEGDPPNDAVGGMSWLFPPAIPLQGDDAANLGDDGGEVGEDGVSFLFNRSLTALF